MSGRDVRRPRLAVDMDEVIADALGERIRRYNAEFGAALTRSDIEGKGFYQALPEAHRERAREHLHEPGFFADLDVIDGAQEALRALHGRYDLVIATAAMEVPSSFYDKYAWLRRHFPFLDPQLFVFCGRKEVVAADILIDDTPQQLERFGGRGILFSAPKNLGETRFERLETWSAAEALLLGLRAAD